MSNLEAKFQDVSGSRYNANINFAHGYRQLPLAKSSQEMLSIQTPLGVSSSKRLLQGGKDSGNHFQAVVSEKFEPHITKMNQWLDDFLLYASTKTELLDNIENFFIVCTDVGLKVHAKKIPILHN